MSIQTYEDVSSHSVGKVKNFCTVTSTIALSFSLAAICPDYSAPTEPCTLHHEKVSIGQTRSTGSGELFQKDLNNYYKIRAFAENFLSNLAHTPPEFDDFLNENFWDLLA